MDEGVADDMPVISYYTCLLQMVIITIRIHRRMFIQLAGILGTMALILFFLTGSVLLNHPASITWGMLSILGQRW